MQCIDADSHIVPRDWMKHMEESYTKKLPTYCFDKRGVLSQESNLENDPNPTSINSLPLVSHNSHSGRYDIEKRKEDLPMLGIDLQILNPEEHAMRFSYLVESEMAQQMAYSYNRTVAEIVKHNKDKFAATLLLPLQDMEWSLGEINWGIDNGFNSIYIDTCWPVVEDPASYPMADIPGICRLFEYCQHKEILVVAHAQSHHRFIKSRADSKKYRLKDLYPSQHKVSLISLVTSGLLDQYPRLRILICEGGMEFIKESLEYLIKIGITDPMRYFRENFYFTIETENTALLIECIDLFGADRFLFATDYPHDDPGGAGRFEDRSHMDQLGLDPSDLQLILSGNTRRLFKL